MRVKGNISPNVLNIEPYAPKAGHVEVRLRDNINPIVETDEMTGQEISMFEYDEYTFVLPDREGLREDIEANMADWLVTGRTLEVNEGASCAWTFASATARTRWCGSLIRILLWPMSLRPVRWF